MTTVTKRRDTAIVTLNNPPLNVLNLSTKAAIIQTIKDIDADTSIKTIVLTGSKAAFSAGADIREFQDPKAAADAPVRSGITAVTKVLEACSKPIVAVISGVCLGGGLEVALGCHYRLAHRSARIGLPEVQLGLIPDATGTQKIPRLTSITNAIDILTTGRHLSAKESLELGLVDMVLDSDDPLEEGVAYAERVANTPLDPRRISKMAVKMDDDTPAIIRDAYKKVAAKFRGQYSPLMVIRAVEAATKVESFEEGLQMEGKYFDFLVHTDQFRALLYAFFAERAVPKWRMPDGSADFKTCRAQAVSSGAVIGAGTMGTGIAVALIRIGIPTFLIEQDQEYLRKGLSTIQGYLASEVRRGRMSQSQTERAYSLLTPTLDYDDLRDVDLVIEAVFENMSVKKAIFRKLEKACKPSAVLASNTSGLDIDELASVTSRPEKVVGMHFFAPAHLMKVLENIRGKRTSPETIATAMDMGKRLNKISVLVGNCPYFVGNRMLVPYRSEALVLLEEGALPIEVDTILEDFGVILGPFKMADLVGHDVGYRGRESRGLIERADQHDVVRRGEAYYNLLPDRLVEMGRLGQKTGKGFYDYGKPGGRNPEIDPEVTKMILDLSKKLGITRRHISAQEIVERCFYSLVNEGFKCLEEGIASSEQDIDMIWIHGYGWPKHTGGPMYHARHTIGLPRLFERIYFYSLAYPDHTYWKPSDLLKKLVAEGRKTSSL